jgi:hypothetical protein
MPYITALVNSSKNQYILLGEYTLEYRALCMGQAETKANWNLRRDDIYIKYGPLLHLPPQDITHLINRTVIDNRPEIKEYFNLYDLYK